MLRSLAQARRRAKDCESPGAKEAIRLTPIRKATFLGLLSLIVLLALAATAAAGPIAAKKAKLAAVQAQLGKVYEQSDMAVERYNEAASKLENVQDRIIRNQHLLKVAEYKLGVANDHLTSRARQVYKANDAGIMDVVFASRTFDDLLTQLDVMQRMTQSDADTAREAKVYRQEISDRRIALEADRASAVKLVAQRQESKEQVLALQSQLEGAAGGLKNEIADLEAKAAAAAKAKAEAAALAASQTASSSNGSSGSSGSSSSGGGRRRHHRRPRRLRSLVASWPSPSATSASPTSGAAPARAASTAPASPCTATRRSASASRTAPPTSSAPAIPSRSARCSPATSSSSAAPATATTWASTSAAAA